MTRLDEPVLGKEGVRLLPIEGRALELGMNGEDGGHILGLAFLAGVRKKGNCGLTCSAATSWRE